MTALDPTRKLPSLLQHDEIASMANASRVNTSQAISAWRPQELLTGTRGDNHVNVRGVEVLIEQLELEVLA